MPSITRDIKRHKDRARIYFSGNDTLYPLPPDESIQISSWEEFLKIGTEYPANGNYALTKDIDISHLGYIYHPQVNLVEGKFDGRGHTISGLKTSRTEYENASENYMGLFGTLNYSLVKNLNISNFDMTCLVIGTLAATINGTRLINCNVYDSNIGGGLYAGGLWSLGSLNTIAKCSVNNSTIIAHVPVGLGTLLNSAHVIDCHVSNSTLSGTGGISGFIGLIEENSSGKIEYCSVDGIHLEFPEGESESNFMGACGFIISSQSSHEIKNCFANCTFGYMPSGVNAGFIGIADKGVYIEDCYAVTNGLSVGFASTAPDATAINCYWDITTSDQTSSALGIGKTTIEMQTCSTFDAWDTDNIWICSDQSYPTLKEFTGYIEYISLEEIEIDTVEKFQKIGVDSDYPNYSNYLLMADLDLTGIEWTPINLSNGIFDGNNHVISNLTINSPSSDGQGLFNRVSRLSHLTIKDSEVIGKSQVGILLGGDQNINTIIKDCTSLNCTVTGSRMIGGICSEANVVNYCYSDSTIINDQGEIYTYLGGIGGNVPLTEYCGFEGEIKLNNESTPYSVGGIIGQGGVKKCYALCDVTGYRYVGGIVGQSTSEVSDCVHIGVVSGAVGVGGIQGSNGFNAPAHIFRCYHSGNMYGSEVSTAPIFGTDYSAPPENHEIENCYYNGDSHYDGINNNYGISLDTSEMTCPTDSFEGFDFDEIWDCETGQMPFLKDELFIVPDDENGFNGNIYLGYPVNDNQQMRNFTIIPGNNWWFDNVYVTFSNVFENNEESKLILYAGGETYLIQELTALKNFIQKPIHLQNGDRIVVTITGEGNTEYTGPYYEGYITFVKD